MSGQRAPTEPYVTRFETEITAIDGRRVWLERSYFYAESGGQPADRGTIGDVDVVDVQLEGGGPVHYLAEEPSFSVGHRVLCSIDWSFRMYCMRAHTASHVLYGAGRRLLDDLDYAGFDIDEERVRIDLETTTTVDDETLIALDELVNRVVWESRPVSWEEVPVAEVREREDVAFNEATEDGAFEKGRVRLVTIGGKDDNGGPAGNGRVLGNGSGLRTGATVTVSGGGSRDVWDVAACGGTHVRNTREIGPVTVLGRSNPGEGVTRVELAVGPTAIERRATEKRAVFDAKRALGTSVEDVTDELERVVTDRDDLADRLRTRERELAAERLERASPVDRDGDRWLIATVGDLPSATAADVVRERTGGGDGEVSDDGDANDDPDDGDGTERDRSTADVIVAIGEADATYAVVGASGGRSAAAVLDELTDAFGGGGGGTDDLAQGGGFDATPEDVRRSLE